MTESVASSGVDRADPRTHLVTLLVATVFWAVYSPQLIHYLAVLCAAYLFANGMARHALGFAAVYVALTLIAGASVFVMPLLYVILNTFARAVPIDDACGGARGEQSQQGDGRRAEDRGS